MPEPLCCRCSLRWGSGTSRHLALPKGTVQPWDLAHPNVPGVGHRGQSRVPHAASKGLTGIFMCVGGWLGTGGTSGGWGRGAGQCSSPACGWEVPSAPGAAPRLLALLGQRCDVLLSPLPAAPFSLSRGSGDAGG